MSIKERDYLWNVLVSKLKFQTLISQPYLTGFVRFKDWTYLYIFNFLFSFVFIRVLVYILSYEQILLPTSYTFI